MLDSLHPPAYAGGFSAELKMLNISDLEITLGKAEKPNQPGRQEDSEKILSLAIGLKNGETIYATRAQIDFATRRIGDSVIAAISNHSSEFQKAVRFFAGSKRNQIRNVILVAEDGKSRIIRTEPWR
ncbi:MAG: hypothetical protein WCV72_01900 [Patescibacteria group bacterium]